MQFVNYVIYDVILHNIFIWLITFMTYKSKTNKWIQNIV